ARNLRDLERVREAGAVVIARGREEHLRLVLQPAERLAVDDAIAVALIGWPHIVFALRSQTSARVRALGGLRRERFALPLLQPFTDGGQRGPPGNWYREQAGQRQNSPPSSDQGQQTSCACLTPHLSSLERPPP